MKLATPEGLTSALPVRRGFDLNRLKAVFIAHLHEDRGAELSGIIKHWVKKSAPEVTTVLSAG